MLVFKVENYRNIDGIEIIFNPECNYIIGENNLGKSNFLSLLTTVCNEVYSLPKPEETPEGYKEISFVCLRPDGVYEAPSAMGIMCRSFSDTPMSVPQ